jgi:probable F420-dependent oxidoreductase
MVAVGIGLLNVQNFFDGDQKAVARAAADAEEAGVDFVSITDHIVMSEKLGDYPYGSFPLPLTAPWYEPVVTLAAISALTEKIALHTAILVSPLRPAVLLAKQVATLDDLSGGRVRIGFGVGWQRAEYDSTGVPWEERFSRMDEQVRICRLLWSEAPASFQGKHTQFERLHQQPFPRQGARLPIWFGLAPSDRHLRRIAELGDGWIPMDQNLDTLAPNIAKLKAAVAKAGRPAGAVGIRIVPRMRKGADGALDLDATLAQIPDYVKAGATEVELHPAAFCRIAADLKPFFRTLAQAKRLA